ncbi:MAG: DinB family protein [Candidatus Zixiibacteriota bacterium]
MMIHLEPTPGLSPRLGLYFAQMEDVRRVTKRYLEGLTVDQLSWFPNARVESIGTLLLHIAAVEFSWIQEDIARRPMPEEWIIGFPIRFNIPQISGKPLGYFLEKLDEVREETRQLLAGMTDDDLRRAVVPLDDAGRPDAKSYSIEWILYHLIEHEAHHRGQISQLKRLLPPEIAITS